MWILLISCMVVLAASQDAPSCQIKPCCTPVQWEGNVAPLGGIVYRKKPGMIMGMARVHYCAKKKLAASLTNMTISGRSFAIKTVLRQNMLYIVDLEKQKCYKKKMSRPFREKCIPDNAKCVGHFYMGTGKNRLDADTFHVDVRGKRMTRLEVYVSVTKNCIPVGEAIFGRIRGMPIEETISFFNFKLGIKDPSVFDVPKLCDDGRFELLPVDSELNQYRILGF